ncbi:hypothetical protein ABW20_dc0109583 [Dactylellina cionopaga]|nr:hypothetical protein ABW20_dc0109583 [Dactylellina cionopaga]
MANAYDEKKNPNGLINLAISENCLMHRVVFDYLNDNLHLEAKQLTYGDGNIGSVRLRKNLSGFLNAYFKPIKNVKPEEIIVSSGVSGVIDELAWTICNEGDGILVGKPAYCGFAKGKSFSRRRKMVLKLIESGNGEADFHTKSRALSVPVSFDDIDPFSVESLACYEQELKRFNNSHSNARIRAVLIANPHNPLGKCYPRETLEALMKFCEAHNLHLIADEIYALSIFKTKSNKDAVGFCSTLSINTAGLIDPKRIHMLYGMSKDFCSNGLRIGFIISRSTRIIKAISSIALFSWPSALADLAWSIMLEDSTFLKYYLSEHQRKLGERYQFLADILDKLGIKYFKGGNAGCFMWMDLSFALEMPTRGDGPRIEDSVNLHRKLMKGGVLLGAGYLAEKPGWFRITFAQPKQLVLRGIEKMMKVLKAVDIDLAAKTSTQLEEGFSKS